MMISMRSGAVFSSARTSWKNRSSIVARVTAAAAVIGALVFAPKPAAAQFTQQGPKLVGSGAIGLFTQQGSSVAVSADGNTMISGGPGDNADTGAAWVFSRSGGVWTQQAKLTPNDAVGSPGFGFVALSADGNTAMVGGPGDSNCSPSPCGAAWIFTRTGSTWTEQQKLMAMAPKVFGLGGSVALSADGNTAVAGTFDSSVAASAVVFARNGTVWSETTHLSSSEPCAFSNPGTSVAVSGDGQTAIIGGRWDGACTGNGASGAAWVFAFNGSGWSQQAKLVGTGGSFDAQQGMSVALSYDGNTALVGGGGDNSLIGATWVFTRSNGVWTQQTKLVGNGGLAGGGSPGQGASVALSADGNTAISGAENDASDIGAAWVFSRTSGVWSQRGSKLAGSGEGSGGLFGRAVALSRHGNTAVVGGSLDSGFIGATWIFVRTVQPNTHDFNGDGMSDIAWRDIRGNTAIWLMNGAAILSLGEIGTVPTSWSIVGQRDFDGDGKADLLWRDTLGNTAIWFMNGTQVASSASVGNLPMAWSVVGTGDFNGDGLGDILWRDGSGNLAVWLMNGASIVSSGAIGTVPSTWTVAGTGDFDGDGKTDLLWRDAGGNIAIWFLNGVQVASSANVGNIATSWSIVGTGDFDGDGKSDIVWRDTLGDTSIWLMNGATLSSAGGLGNVPTTWSMVLTGDYDGDGKSDLLWRDTGGNTAIWFMNGVSVSSTASTGNIPTGWVPWTVQSANAE
jgi:VCBS repeat protein/FG-GAP repeat protein